MFVSTSSILAHHQHPSTRSRTRPQHARTHDHRAGSVVKAQGGGGALCRRPCGCSSHARSVAVHAMPHAPLQRASSPPSSLYHRTHAAFLSFVQQDLARRSHCPRWSCSTHGAFLFFFRVPTLFLAGRFFFLPAPHCAARHASPHARTFASPRMDDRRTNDATCGPQAWLTGGRLHGGGIRSVRSPLRRFPLLATPIATPLQCGRP